ncbi:hypothetical protein E1171_15355 [Cytophagales bacterium RKSG123]|nr:hypothetical protein [Xanthovirga aplysinae]
MNIFFNLFIAKHPFHVSVSDMQYNEKSKSIEITHKIFVDDLEEALKDYSGEKIDLAGEENLEKNQELISNYLNEKFHISINGKTVKGTYIGQEEDNGSVWCYVELKNIRKIKEVRVTDKILVDFYEDQTNLVHLKYHGELKSLMLNYKKTEGEIKFD